MASMGLVRDLQGLMVQRSARWSARYGDALYFSGTDLPEPSILRVPTRRGTVRCHVYRPDADGGSLPVYVHFHGGAYLMRYPQMDDFWARMVCAEVGAVVVNVDYDVAPQRRFPVAHEQCHDVPAWLSRHPETLGIDPERLVVGGFSAGGGLAASAALQARDQDSFRPAGQLLGVPSLDVAEDPAMKQSVISDPMITPDLLELVRATYFKKKSARSSPYASPLRAIDLRGLPPALVISAEYDRLRAEADRYAERLLEARVPVEHHVVAAADHYFLDRGRDRARLTLDRMVDWLTGRLGVVRGPSS
jgi:acetyl esterase